LENAAPLGSAIFQPGALDANCAIPGTNRIGELYKFIPLDFSLNSQNVIDAAIMKTDKDLVNTTTLSDGYGVPRSDTVKAFLGQKVQKYGRTTGYTKGFVSAINVSFFIAYTPGVAFFVKQIGVTGDQGGLIPFGGPGDSGSLVVDMDRRPVALLFAGGGFPIIITQCNPIDDVLAAFEIDGLAVDDSEATTIGKVGSSTD
jgi:hypothetical protein